MQPLLTISDNAAFFCVEFQQSVVKPGIRMGYDSAELDIWAEAEGQLASYADMDEEGRMKVRLRPGATPSMVQHDLHVTPALFL